MKKILCAGTLVVMTCISAYANTDEPYGKTDRAARKQIRKERREERRQEWLHSVSVQTENQFYQDFSNAKDVTWTEGAFAEANFTDGSIRKTAFYDWENELVGTTSIVDYSALPEKARNFIAEKYPGYTIDKIVFFDDNEINETDMFLYNTTFQDEDNYFPFLTNGTKQIILKVAMNGDTSFFQSYK